MKSPRKPKTAIPTTGTAQASTRSPQANLAGWLRMLADNADRGAVTSFAAVATTADYPLPMTNIVDPGNSRDRLMLSGSCHQLAAMLHDTETRLRMQQVAETRVMDAPSA